MTWRSTTPNNFAVIGDELVDQALIVDARFDEALREAGAGQCDIGVVSICGNLEASIVATMTLNVIGAR